MNEVNISQWTDSNFDPWNKYVLKCENSTFFHLAQWRNIFENILGHRAFYFYAIQNDEIVGIFPLVLVKSKLFGSAFISVPFGVYGGCLANSSQIYSALTAHAVETAKEYDVDYIETRELQDSESDWVTKDLYVTFRKTLLPTEEEKS